PPSHRDLPSFPTRRSSDLREGPWARFHGSRTGGECSTRVQADDGGRRIRQQTPDHWVKTQRATAIDRSPLISLVAGAGFEPATLDRKSTRLNSSHQIISYA